MYLQQVASCFLFLYCQCVCGANNNADTSATTLNFHATSLFQADLLQTHGLHIKQYLTDALQHELNISSRDDRVTVRIHCIDLAMKLPGFYYSICLLCTV